jgi:hypothetical protein
MYATNCSGLPKAARRPPRRQQWRKALVAFGFSSVARARTLIESGLRTAARPPNKTSDTFEISVLPGSGRFLS